MRELRDEGKSLRQIAATMETEGIRTKAGTTWYPATVRRLLATVDDAISEELLQGR